MKSASRLPAGENWKIRETVDVFLDLGCLLVSIAQMYTDCLLLLGLVLRCRRLLASEITLPLLIFFYNLLLRAALELFLSTMISQYSAIRKTRISFLILRQ